VIDGDLKRASSDTNDFHWNRLWQKGIQGGTKHNRCEDDQKQTLFTDLHCSLVS
jgi:hypothetical protein